MISLSRTLDSHSYASLDCSGPRFGNIKRLRLRFVYRFRVFGRGHRIDEWPIPDEQGHQCAICVQEGREGRTARYIRGASPRCASTKEQCVACQCPATPCTDGVWCATPHAWFPRAVPGSVCWRVGAAASAPWVHTSADDGASGDAYDGCAGWDAYGDGSAASEHGHVPAWLIPPATTTWIYAWDDATAGRNGASSASRTAVLVCTFVKLIVVM